MSNHSLEIIRKIWNNAAGAYIGVGPDREGIGCIEVFTDEKDKRSVEHFGKLSLLLSKEEAAFLGKALLAASEECDG